jgi:hypothetical protein
MESLFQPGPQGRRLFALVRDLIAAHYAPGPGRAWRGLRVVAGALWLDGATLKISAGA